MQDIAIRKPFYGAQRCAFALNSEDRAAFDGSSIQMHHTGATLAGVAPDMRTGKTKRVANELDEKRPVFDFSRYALSINRQGYNRHYFTRGYAVTSVAVSGESSSPTTFAKFSKNRSTSFRTVESIRRAPSCAIFPPTVALAL